MTALLRVCIPQHKAGQTSLAKAVELLPLKQRYEALMLRTLALAPSPDDLDAVVGARAQLTIDERSELADCEAWMPARSIALWRLFAKYRHELLVRERAVVQASSAAVANAVAAPTKKRESFFGGMRKRSSVPTVSAAPSSSSCCASAPPPLGGAAAAKAEDKEGGALVAGAVASAGKKEGAAAQTPSAGRRRPGKSAKARGKDGASLNQMFAHNAELFRLKRREWHMQEDEITSVLTMVGAGEPIHDEGALKADGSGVAKGAEHDAKLPALLLDAPERFEVTCGRA